MKNLHLLTLFLPLLLVAGLLAACTDDSAWRNDPAVVAARDICKSKSGVDYDCIERQAVTALNPEICRLAGIGIDDMCLQAVYEAAGDPSICDRIYLQGVVPNCRAYYAQHTPAPTSPAGTSEAPILTLTLPPTLTPAPASPSQGTALATYHSPSLGISFEYPVGWEEVAEGRYQGEDGFFQVSPYKSIASGLSDAYHRLSFRMVRACTWEANAIPGQYGQDPELRLLSDIPGRAQCQITPGAGAQQASPTLLFETPNEGWGLLHADERQMALIQRTLVYDQPGGRAQQCEEYPCSAEEIKPELSRHTKRMGELTLEEYSLFPSSKNTPMEDQLAGALAAVRVNRDAWRAGPVPDYEPESLERDNAALAPFGYRLESFTIENGELRMRLYRGEALIKDNLSLYPRSLVVEPVHQADIALIVEEAGVGLWLIRRDSLERWDVWAHLDSYDVAFAGGRLVAYEFEPTDWSGTLWVTLNGERVHSLLVPWRPLSVQIDNWQDNWVLEMDGTLSVDGEIMNLAWGYGEIFEYRLLDGKPFFFYEQGGQVGISYDGQELPVRYDEVIHGECCGGMNNPRSSEQMVSFYARRDGMWYYVEIGKYD